QLALGPSKELVRRLVQTEGRSGRVQLFLCDLEWVELSHVCVSLDSGVAGTIVRWISECKRNGPIPGCMRSITFVYLCSRRIEPDGKIEPGPSGVPRREPSADRGRRAVPGGYGAPDIQA